MSTKDRVIRILSDLAGETAAKIEASDNLVADLGLDSMDTLEIIAHFEDEFEIDIEEDDVAGFKTVSDWTAYIDTALAEAT